MTRSIEIVVPGVLSTVQDAGRLGYRAAGVGIAGALDALALVVANRMAGNVDDAAALECTLGGARVRITAPMRVAIAGAECDARLDGARLPAWSCAFAEAGSELVLARATNGARTMLAFGGGVDVPAVLGSRSTDLGAGFGGFEGRALRAGDVLPIGEAAQASRAAFRLQPPQWALHRATDDTRTIVVRALAGPEADACDVRFWPSAWEITPQSNRMGFRLAGPALTAASGGGAMASHAVMPGIVQVPADGQPIVLLADAQTTGGYPRVAVAIEADLWRLAQAPIGARVRFERVTYEQARAARLDVERYCSATAAAIAAQMNV